MPLKLVANSRPHLGLLLALTFALGFSLLLSARALAATIPPVYDTK